MLRSSQLLVLGFGSLVDSLDGSHSSFHFGYDCNSNFGSADVECSLLATSRSATDSYQQCYP